MCLVLVFLMVLAAGVSCLLGVAGCCWGRGFSCLLRRPVWERGTPRRRIGKYSSYCTGAHRTFEFHHGLAWCVCMGCCRVAWLELFLDLDDRIPDSRRQMSGCQKMVDTWGHRKCCRHWWHSII